ncbi:glutathione S-transferase [Hasllibacter sp. MH4015]|uniref:glutathione S-transferase n=1 Tax=Hasllibacter sp. MH4015 TaxID=2854029 RepID=UPI001CD7FA96|nr:glutathione S-transferase [Hasllibacter sp. MH4015]
MELLGSPASPFVRKARIALAEARITDIPFVEVAASPMGGDDTINAANPLGKIPALRRDDGPTIYDSNVVCRFLDDRADAGLYPKARLWEVLTLEATGDGIMEAAVGMIYEKRFRPEDKHWQPWFDGQWAKINRALDVLGRQWMSHLYGPVDMGQVSVACALGYLDFRFPDDDWRTGRDGLSAWYKTFAERPSMVETAPE